MRDPTPEEAFAILQGVKERYETHHGALIADDALEAGMHLSAGWLPDRHLPDKALDLLDEACARVPLSAPPLTWAQGWSSLPRPSLKYCPGGSVCQPKGC